MTVGELAEGEYRDTVLSRRRMAGVACFRSGLAADVLEADQGDIEKLLRRS